jgi:hypothetical protein
MNEYDLIQMMIIVANTDDESGMAAVQDALSEKGRGDLSDAIAGGLHMNAKRMAIYKQVVDWFKDMAFIADKKLRELELKQGIPCPHPNDDVVGGGVFRPSYCTRCGEEL